MNDIKSEAVTKQQREKVKLNQSMCLKNVNNVEQSCCRSAIICFNQHSIIIIIIITSSRCGFTGKPDTDLDQKVALQFVFSQETKSAFTQKHFLCVLLLRRYVNTDTRCGHQQVTTRLP